MQVYFDIISSSDIMGVTVDVKSDGGVLINRYEKNQQIFIPRESWLQIIALKTDIEQCIESKQEKRWAIGNNLCAFTSKYNDEFYTHIRVWWNNQPTRQGITITESEWVHFSNFLHFDSETTLGYDLLVNMLTDAINVVIKSECEGCREQYPSQQDHDCLMNSAHTAQRCVNDVFENLCVFDFIKKLAEKGSEKKIVIKKPHDVYKILLGYKDDEIKLAALAKFQ